jgi:hypothetical protein
LPLTYRKVVRIDPLVKEWRVVWNPLRRPALPLDAERVFRVGVRHLKRAQGINEGSYYDDLEPVESGMGLFAGLARDFGNPDKVFLNQTGKPVVFQIPRP